MESEVDLVWWRWSWRFVWWSQLSCVSLVSFVCAWVIKRFSVTKLCVDQAVRWCDVLVGICGVRQCDVLGDVLGEILGEVHGDVLSKRWKVEALTQEKFSKDGFIEEVWKDCSCVKTMSSGAAGWDLCMRS